MTELLEVTCGVCEIVFGITQPYYEGKRASGDFFYCPNGHCVHWPLMDLLRERDLLKTENAVLAQQIPKRGRGGRFVRRDD